MATSNVDEARILVVAALGRELAALRKDVPPGVELLETGEGVGNAERSLETWLSQRKARAVLSIGFAGALTGSLGVGDLVIAREVRGVAARPDETLLAAAGSVRLSGSAPRFGVAVTANEILWRAESKRALAQTLDKGELGFVDMESTAIALVCGRRGVSFLIVRSVTDLLDEDLPLDFNLYRDAEGRVDSGKVLKAAMLRPSALAGLLDLRKRSEVCADRMARLLRGLISSL